MDKDKVELLINSLDAIRRFRNCAAHSLNFFGCRTVYNIPGNILYTVLPKGVLKREKGQITLADKKSLKGIFGVLLMIALLLRDKLLVTSLIHECRNILGTVDISDDSPPGLVEYLNELKGKYKESTEIPFDFIERLDTINESIN